MTTSLRERAQALLDENLRAQEEARVKADIDKLEQTRENALRLIAALAGEDANTDDGIRINLYGYGSAHFSIDGIRFQTRYLTSHDVENPHRYSAWSLFLERRCTREGCLQPDVPVLTRVTDLANLAWKLSGTAEHDWNARCTLPRNEEGDPIRPPAPPIDTRTPEEVALADAADRCGQAHARVMELEDERALIKAACIRSMIGSLNEITGKPHSASSAEAIIESHADYAQHRALQREAEVEKWHALGVLKAAELRARLAGQQQ